ncbi:MAG: EAL domain-containing protein [Kangiellaceae bacterium]|nr:EAL domain-containing protein [Kangiellaceae bacterium]
MVSRQFKTLVWFMAVVVFSGFMLAKYSTSHTTIEQAQQKVIASELAKIQLLLAQHFNKSITRQNLGDLLSRLDTLPQIDFWRLKDEQNKVVDAKRGSPPETPTWYHFYLNTQQNTILTIEVNLRVPPASTELLTPLDWLIIVGVICLLSGFIFWRFNWVFNLEKYAHYILEHGGANNSTKISGPSNAVTRAINQLILSNTLLHRDKIELTEQIRKTSYVDEVTELGNQLFFKAEFQVRLHHHEEPESGLLILLSFVEKDFESNQVLNDSRLRGIANILRQYIAQIPGSLVARLRGSDFAMLLPNQTKNNVDMICKTLIRQLEKTVFDKTQIKEQFVDVGISAYHQGFDYYKVLSEADMALRNSQLQGGNNWFMYGEALSSDKVRGNLKWRSFLQRTLDKRKVQLYGQRIKYFDQSKTDHHEVYARIEDGNEVLAADTFLPMANQCGLAAEFDRQVVDGVIKHYLFSEMELSNQIYSINLFISSLLDERFVGWLVGKLSSFPELCRHIVFEIKEVNINQNLEKLKIVMPQLSNLGVGWCVERFGSPDEELTYLDLLPIRMVKIDRRMINNIHQEAHQQLLLKSLLISLASKNIKVFAEGVEKSEDADYLRDLDLQGAQGYFYSKPKRLKKIEKYLRAI